MKKKLIPIFLITLLALLFTSCDEVLSVVTVNEKGEKVVNNYVAMLSDESYDGTISFNSWEKILIDEELQMDNLIFTIENKKENVVVLGNKQEALEIKFFDGGYKCTVFASMDSLNRMFESY